MDSEQSGGDTPAGKGRRAGGMYAYVRRETEHLAEQAAEAARARPRP